MAQGARGQPDCPFRLQASSASLSLSLFVSLCLRAPLPVLSPEPFMFTRTDTPQSVPEKHDLIQRSLPAEFAQPLERETPLNEKVWNLCLETLDYGFVQCKSLTIFRVHKYFSQPSSRPISFLSLGQRNYQNSDPRKDPPMCGRSFGSSIAIFYRALV